MRRSLFRGLEAGKVIGAWFWFTTVQFTEKGRILTTRHILDPGSSPVPQIQKIFSKFKTRKK